MTRASQRRRWVRRGMALLLLGAAINVLVAWACALWSPVERAAIHARWMTGSNAPDHRTLAPPLDDEGAMFRLDRVPRAWREHSGAFGIGPHATADRYLGVGLQQTDIEVILHDGLGRSSPNRVVVVDAGWPFRSMSAEFLQVDPSPLAPPSRRLVAGDGLNVPETTGWRFAIEAPTWLKPRPLAWPTGPLGTRVLPWRPRVVESLVNTLFWGAAIAAPFLLARAAVRHLRHRRGLCPACAYDLKDLATCPECGTPAKQRRDATRA